MAQRGNKRMVKIFPNGIDGSMNKSLIKMNQIKQSRNEICKCGSGLKFKKCCIIKII